jgi:hypothetical protein
MTWHRYETASLVADYFRAAIGVAVCGGLLFVSNLLPAIGYILVVLTFLFGIYGMRTILRQLTRLRVDANGLELCLGSWPWRRMSWQEIQDLKLRYFSTRRDRGDGWLQMLVSGGGKRISFDSNLSDFNVVATQAFRAAQEAGVGFSPTTRDNLKSIGLGLELEVAS